MAGYYCYCFLLLPFTFTFSEGVDNNPNFFPVSTITLIYQFLTFLSSQSLYTNLLHCYFNDSQITFTLFFLLQPNYIYTVLFVKTTLFLHCYFMITVLHRIFMITVLLLHWIFMIPILLIHCFLMITILLLQCYFYDNNTVLYLQ